MVEDAVVGVFENSVFSSLFWRLVVKKVLLDVLSMLRVSIRLFLAFFGCNLLKLAMISSMCLSSSSRQLG
jgi:hypothetical protein